MWSTLRNKGLPALRQQLGGAQLYHGRPLPSALPFSARKGVIAAAKRKSGPRSSRSTTDEPAEQNNGNQPRAAAYRREKVHINNQNYTVRNLLLLIKEKTLNLEPEYQRDFVWDPKRCMGLLMTVYEGLVIPPIILHERTNADGKLVYEVVDGKQRLATLWTFIEGDNTLFPKAPVMFELDKEEDDLYAVLNGKTFAMLDDEEKKYFNQFDVHVQLILENTPLEKVFRIYEGINSGGMGHSKQQMRRAAFYGPYVELLGELTKSDKGKKYKQLAEVTEKEETEQQLEELILRFFALRRAGIDGSGRRFRVPMKNFLNSELQMEGPGGRKVVKALTEKENKGMTHTFEKTVELMDTLGLKEVAEQELGGKIRSPRKVTPAWDITLVGLSRALDRNDNIGVYECNAAAMRQNYRSLLGCPEWKGISNTLSHTSLVKRLDLFLDKVVKPALKGDYTQATQSGAPVPGSRSGCEEDGGTDDGSAAVAPGEPTAAARRRLFSEALKAEAYVRNPTCAWCGKPISRLSHAEADHVLPYALGGTTTLDNCQVLHRRCNRIKGKRGMSEGPAAKGPAAAAVMVAADAIGNALVVAEDIVGNE